MVSRSGWWWGAALVLVLGMSPGITRAEEKEDAGTKESEPKDVADVPHADLEAGKDANKRYFLIGDTKKAPKDGFKLLLVMPGGGGDAGFRAFVKRMYKHAFKAKGYVVAQLVSKKWTPEQYIIWPTAKVKAKKMKFSTEAFVEAVIKDVSKAHKINAKRIYTLSWSSGGPAAYAVSLTSKKVKGSLIAMSVFKPNELPSLKKAKGHAYYLLHSEEDKVCPYRMAKDAEKQLTKKGAKVKFVDYAGGHGWHMPVFPELAKGIDWLEGNSK